MMGDTRIDANNGLEVMTNDVTSYDQSTPCSIRVLLHESLKKRPELESTAISIQYCPDPHQSETSETMSRLYCLGTILNTKHPI